MDNTPLRFTPPRLDIPEGAVDTHVHVFDPSGFQFAEGRTYTPGVATLDDLRACHAALGVSRAVLVQPSVYGTDNSCLLDALQSGTERLCGIAVVDLDGITGSDLVALDAAGVRGIRLNLEVRHEHDPVHVRSELERAASAINAPGWCVQIHCGADVLPVVEATLDAFRVPLVLDHFAGLKSSDADPGSRRLAVLQRLLASGRIYVKLSAFYRASTQTPHHVDLAPLARRLIETRPDRLLWGSDWPHTGGGKSRNPSRIEPFREVDLRASLAALASWSTDAAVLRQILVDNPAALYSFAATRQSKETP